MSKLYELANEYNEAFATMSEMGMSQDEIADSMVALEDELAEKAVNCIKYEMNVKSDIDAIDVEIKRLTNKKKQIQNKVSWIKDYLISNMERCEIDKIESPLFTISLRKPTKVAVVTNEEALPIKYLKSKLTVAVDRRTLLTDLKAGEEIEGAEIGDSKRSLMVK